MSSVFTLIGSSWNFYRKQPVLNSILAWLLILPLTLHSALLNADENGVSFLGEVLAQSTQMNEAAVRAITTLLTLGLSVWVLLGQAGVMVIGKRLLQSKAGRSRSSFKTVRSQASSVLIPLFLTEIIRACATLLLTIPAIVLLSMTDVFSESLSLVMPLLGIAALVLFVPPIFFQLRTYFYDIIIVNEGISYRKALSKSSEFMTGKSWQCLWRLACIYAIFFAPALILGIVFDEITFAINPFLLPVSQFVGSSLLAFSILFITLSSIGMFADLKKA